jgi:hypothetical protein
MPYCPTCGFQYREGMATCPDCGGALRPGSPPEPEPEAAPTEETEPVRLCRIADTSEAEIVRAALTQAGIPSVAQSYGPITGRLALVTDGQAPEDYTAILVPCDRLEEARAVLEAMRSAPIEWPEGMEPED